MTRKILSLLLAAALCLSLCACGGDAEVSSLPAATPPATAAPAPTPSAEPSPEPAPEAFDAGAMAEKAALLMAKGDYGAVLAYSNATLKSMADADYLANMWGSVTGTLGSFERVNGAMTITGEYENYRCAVAFCEFSKGGLGLIVLFDESDKIDSLLMNYYSPADTLILEGENLSSPIMWRVTDDKGGEMYLVGSIHLADEELYPLPDEMMTAYYESDALAVEYDTFAASFDFASLLELQSAVVYTDGTSVRDHLRADTYEMAVGLFSEKGMYSSAYDAYVSAQWSTLISQLLYGELGLDAGFGVDSYFLALAHDSGKKILEIESQTSQLQLLMGTGDLYNDAVIRSSVMYYEKSAALVSELYEAYFSGDEENLARILLEEEDIGDEALAVYTADERAAIEAEAEDYAYRMMDGRNALMAEKAAEYLASGETVFFVVGAAHMLGETGVVQLLRDAGFSVDRLEY